MKIKLPYDCDELRWIEIETTPEDEERGQEVICLEMKDRSVVRLVLPQEKTCMFLELIPLPNVPMWFITQVINPMLARRARREKENEE